MNNSEPNIEEDSLYGSNVPMPWKRFGARLFDVLLYGNISIFVGFGLECLVGPHKFIHGDLINFYFIFFLVAWFFLEVALLTKWGNTFGHQLFKIKILATDGHYPTFLQGVKRTALMVLFGLGCLIPLCFIVRLLERFGFIFLTPLASLILGALYIQTFRLAFWDTVSRTNVYGLPISTRRIKVLAFLLLALSALLIISFFINSTFAGLSIPDCELDGDPEGCNGVSIK